MKEFHETTLWVDALNFYKLSAPLIKELKKKGYYRLSEQFEASSGSVCDNIAEGMRRGGNRELMQFLSYARGSCNECLSQIYRIEQLEFITPDERSDYVNKLNSILKQLNGFISYLSSNEYRGAKFKTRST
jgi:four helix bundle protein